MAGRRATLKSCWSMQSRSHARQATMNTNHWYLVSPRREPHPVRAGGTSVGEAIAVSAGGERAGGMWLLYRRRALVGIDTRHETGDTRHERRQLVFLVSRVYFGSTRFGSSATGVRT